MKNILNLIKNHKAEFVHFKFMDIQGIWHDITYHASMINEAILKDGIMFDGSSLKGWKTIEDSDMILIPDDESAFRDHFNEFSSIHVLCTIRDPKTQQSYERDPRSVAKKAQEYLFVSGIADEVRFGPEPEFFIFDHVQYQVTPESSFFHIESTESVRSVLKEHASSHVMPPKSSYCSVSPIDSGNDLRSEMLLRLFDSGVKIEKHHHEVATSQHELGIRYTHLLQAADWVSILKSIVKQVAFSASKTATFMPKPMDHDNGSGMHVHQSLFKNGQNLFAGDQYADLSKMALHYIGGILKHRKALNAFTNPTLNSYRRLVPGFEAPTLAVYSKNNRSAAIRIPHIQSSSAARIEARFPDPSANPYLAFSALLMAGLDGIKNELDPGEAFEKNIYDLSKESRQQLPSLSTSLRESLTALEEDHLFLCEGNVFTVDQIHAYIHMKRDEINDFNRRVTPYDFYLYYSC